jgi:hypothetical protein
MLASDWDVGNAIVELRVLGQRLVEHLDIDLEPLLARLVEERLEALTRPEDLEY